MDASTHQRRGRGSREPYAHFTDGHIVERTIRQPDIELVKLFARYRYLSAEYAAALLGRSYQGVSRRFCSLREKDVNIFQLCERQRTNTAERTIGTLYYELAQEGYALLSEEGIVLPEKREDKIFPHTLMVDQIMASIGIGLRQQDELEIEYRDDLPRKLPLQKKDGREQFMISDHAPFTFHNKSSGKRRHIAGLEADTGSMPIAAKDANRTAIIHKLEHMLYLINSGVLEREYRFGRQFFFLFVFRTDARRESAMRYLEEMTKKQPQLRAHFAFKRHPVYGKSQDKPRATGHMLTEPWKMVGYPDFYLGKPKEAASAGQQADAHQGAH